MYIIYYVSCLCIVVLPSLTVVDHRYYILKIAFFVLL